jgi:hypothetical protein
MRHSAVDWLAVRVGLLRTRIAAKLNALQLPALQHAPVDATTLVAFAVDDDHPALPVGLIRRPTQQDEREQHL